MSRSVNPWAACIDSTGSAEAESDIEDLRELPA